MTLRIMGDEDVTALLRELHRVGARVRVEGDDLRVTAPSGALTADLRGHLRARKADLVDMLRSCEPATPPVIVPDVASRDVPFAPSDLQMAFLIGDQEGLDYRVRPHQYLELELPGLDATRYERALNEVLERHRHDLVVVRDDLRLHEVADFAPVRVTVHDFTTATSAEAEQGVLSVRAGMTSSELPLHHWPWFEAAVSLLPDGRHRLHINNNNFFSDGPGTAALLERVLRRYHDPAAELPPMAICYRDAVTALNEIEQSPLGRRSRDYWLSRIADWPGSPQLPTRSGPPAGRSELVRREWVLEAASWARFTASARQWGLTPTNALYAVFAEVVATWSGSRHFLLNHMMTHRQPLHPQMWEVVGNFASLYPLEVDWRHDEPFGARARRLQAQVMSDVDHTHWSGVKVLQALNQARRSPGRAACPVVVGSGLFMGRTDRPVHSHLETPQTILDYQFWEQSDESLWVVWDVLDRVFEPDVVDVMHAAYRDLVTLLSDVPDAWHRTGFELAASERQRPPAAGCAAVRPRRRAAARRRWPPPRPTPARRCSSTRASRTLAPRSAGPPARSAERCTGPECGPGTSCRSRSASAPSRSPRSSASWARVRRTCPWTRSGRPTGATGSFATPASGPDWWRRTVSSSPGRTQVLPTSPCSPCPTSPPRS